MQSLDYIEINTAQTPNSSIIWLHGLGADGHDFENLVSDLKLPPTLSVRFIFPHAPIQPVTINGGYAMRSWFDILGLDDRSIQDEPGIRKSSQSIEHLIDSLITTGIPHDRIIVAGFSQGGALALHTALRYAKKLAGIIGLSTYLPLADFVAAERHYQNENTPIFLAHGTQDTIVPYRFGKLGDDFLKELGYPVTWRSYPIGHLVSEPEVADISHWIQQTLA